MKLTDADNAADGIFFPALEQNMMFTMRIAHNKHRRCCGKPAQTRNMLLM